MVNLSTAVSTYSGAINCDALGIQSLQYPTSPKKALNCLLFLGRGLSLISWARWAVRCLLPAEMQ